MIMIMKTSKNGQQRSAATITKSIARI